MRGGMPGWVVCARRPSVPALPNTPPSNARCGLLWLRLLQLRLQKTMGSAIGDVRKTLKDNTVIMIRSLGADDDRFPITDVVRDSSLLRAGLA